MIVGNGISPYNNLLVGKDGFAQTLCSYFFEGGHRIDFGDNYDNILAGASPQWTMMFAIRKINNNSTNRYIFNKYIGSGNQRSLFARFNNMQEIVIFISSDGTGGNTAQIRTMTDFSDNNLWLLLIMKYDATKSGLAQLEVKVNDVVIPLVLDAGTFDGPVFDSTQPFKLGSDQSNGLNFEGYFNQHGIFNGLITDEDATTIYNGGEFRKFDDVLSMAHYYPYDNDPFSTNFTVTDEAGSVDGTSGAMAAIDRDCNENPY